MSRISYPQLIKDIADTYRDATGSSEPVVIGELVNKLAEAMSNTGSASSGLMFETKPESNAEILTMYPVTVNNTINNSSSFDTNATAEITKE